MTRQRFASSSLSPSGVLLAGAVLVCLLSLGTVGCGGKKSAPQTTPTPTQVTPQVEPPPPPPLPPPIRNMAPTSSGGRSTTVKVIDSGNPDEGRPTTLIEASRLAKARKQQETRAPIAEITDENLAEYAEGGEVIVLESEPAAPFEPTPSTTDPTTSDLGSDDLRDEDFWRNRALDLRMSWRRTIDEIAELELEAASLRQQFYAEEDPYIRDSQVKPSWDRTLDRLNALREQSSRYQRELDTFLEDGRRAGAQQGWLNQGWELEPTEEERRMVERLKTTEPGEPNVSEPEDAGGDPSLGGGT